MVSRPLSRNRNRAVKLNRRYHLIGRVAHRAFEFEGLQAANRKGCAAMTRKTYCGNLLWQSGLTLLAPVRFDEGAGVPDNKGRSALLYTPRDGRFAGLFAERPIATGDCFRCRESWSLGVEVRNEAVNVRKSDAGRIRQFYTISSRIASQTSVPRSVRR